VARGQDIPALTGIRGVAALTQTDRSDIRPRSEAEHAYNNMGLARIAFALLVIVSHSFENVTGRASEPLVRLFGTMTSGEVAVDGFFLLSGYLITGSYERSKSVRAYLERRVLRIYPGYIVAFLLTILLVVPLSGADPLPWSLREAAKEVYRMVILQTPEASGVFPGIPVPELNLSLWTISYEFRCYLLVIAFGLLGMFRRKRAFLAVLSALLVCRALKVELSLGYHVEEIVGKPTNMLRFAFVFLSGAAFHVFRDAITFDARKAAVASLCLIAAMFSPAVAEPAFGTFGAYVLFWLTLHCPVTRYSRFDSHTDLSYGTYLYAWPIQSLAIYYVAGISPLSVLAISAPAAIVLAFASWHLIERPFMRLKQRVAL
jgi:peptidoglycan/LPS O-acetylase OafA/YrhL